MSDILKYAESIFNEITTISEQIDSAYWVRTGKHLETNDFMPEIVAAVIYVLKKLDEQAGGCPPHDWNNDGETCRKCDIKD